MNQQHKPLSKTIRLKESACLKCGHKIDAASSLKNNKPKANDISICIYCNNIAKYNEHMEIIAFSKKELMELKYEDNGRSWQQIVKLVETNLLAETLYNRPKK